jgi:hypothetical protein
MASMKKEHILSYRTVLLLIPLSLTLYLTSFYFEPSPIVSSIISLYQGNSTSAQMHVDIANNFSIFALTLGYVILTLILVIQSKEAIARTKNEQQIRDVENRLGKFYLPTIDKINESRKFEEVCPHRFFATYGENKGTEKDPIYIQHHGFDEISHYRYLAEKETLDKVETILLMKKGFPKNTELMSGEIKNLKKLLEKDRAKLMIKLQDLNDLQNK